MLGTRVKPLLSCNVIIQFTCSVVLTAISSFITDMYMFVFLTIAFFYDGPPTMYLTFVQMLSSREIKDGPNRYWSSFALHIGGVSAYFVSLQ